MCQQGYYRDAAGMRLRHARDRKIDQLRSVTGIGSNDKLIELGRLVDDIVTAPCGRDLLNDKYGAQHAVVVVAGTVHRPRLGVIHRAGEIFQTMPFERIQSLDTTALIAPVAAMNRLTELLAPSARRTMTRRTNQPTLQMLDHNDASANRPTMRLAPVQHPSPVIRNSIQQSTALTRSLGR